MKDTQSYSSFGTRLAGGVTAATEGIPPAVIKQLPSAIWASERGQTFA